MATVESPIARFERKVAAARAEYLRERRRALDRLWRVPLHRKAKRATSLGLDRMLRK